MKYIKKFENNDTQDQDNSFWLIKGNYEHIAKILSIFLKDKFSIKMNGLEPAITIIDDMYRNIFIKEDYNVKNIISVYIGYQEKKRYSYWINQSIDDENEGEEHYKENEYIYRGDLVLENDKVVIDRYKLDAENYNI